MKRPSFPYAALFDAIPIGLYRRTPDGRLSDLNNALLQASGWPDKKSLLAANICDLYEDQEDLGRLNSALTRDGVVRNFETRLRRHHEPPLWVEINAVAVRDEAGDVLCYEGTITPIVERKAMEAELRRSEQRMRAIMNALDEVVVIVDRDQRFLSVLGHRLRDIGFLPHAVVGKTVREVFGKAQSHVHEEAGKRALAGERVVYEWMAETPDTHWFQVSLFPLREPTGEVIGVVGTAYDMTHLKQTQQKLAHALAEKDGLLKEVHHRVKNNLQIVSSLLNLQFDRVQDPELRAMVMESQQRIRAMALVHEQLYRSETLMRIDTRVFLEGLVWSLVRSYTATGQHVEAIVQADPAPIDLDVAIPIALVINELVSNSLKYAFADGGPAKRLVVSLKREADGRRTLTVRDNGVGLPPGFDMATTQTLGLSLVVNLVRQIGGQVSSRVEGGTEFTVVF